MFKRVCTFRQIVLLFNYHIITHAAYLDEKKFQQRPKFQNCVKDLWYWFAMRFPMLELTWTFKKKLLKSWRTLFRVDISSTFCWFELMSGRTNVLTPLVQTSVTNNVLFVHTFFHNFANNFCRKIFIHNHCSHLFLSMSTSSLCQPVFCIQYKNQQHFHAYVNLRFMLTCIRCQ